VAAGEALARREHGPHAPSAAVPDGEPAHRDVDQEDRSAALAQLRVANLFGRRQQAPPAAGAPGNGDASSSLTTSGPWLAVCSHPSRCHWVAAAAAWPLCCAERVTGDWRVGLAGENICPDDLERQRWLAGSLKPLPR
jgi:hypothetical protein